MSSRRLLGWLPTLLITVGGVLAIWQRQNIIDWWRLRSYQPPDRIVALAEATTMTDYGRKLFYVNHPELNDKTTFSGHCKITEETIVLGCYIQNKGIFLYDVQDQRLKGVHEVTAAHEMLHAAYERLSSKEKQRLDKLSGDFFATVTDARVKETVDSYRARDPSVVPNELHSIIATEVRDIPSELEIYYQKYFTNRRSIVEFSERYEQAFTDLKNRVADYDAKLASLKTRIDANETTLRQLRDEIETDRARLDAMLASNDVAGYNAAVPGFNQKVRRYNSLLNETRNLISEYNRLVEERNQLAAQQQELIEAIDTRLGTQQQE